MLQGKYKDQKVLDIRLTLIDELINSGDAMVYYEPGGHVVSRSGSICAAKNSDQWFFDFADK